MGFIFGVLVSEIFLRVGGVAYPKFYQADVERGFSPRPGIEGWYELEGRAYVKINSDGLRDREHTKAKPPDTLRIAVLGDSYTEALQVSLEETFWSVMAARLRECPRPGRMGQVEVINFGVSGYGTAQELITLRQHVWQYSPDIVLLAFLPANDVTDNSRLLRANNQKDVPYFVVRDGQLILDASFREAPAFQFRQSRLYRLGTWFHDRSRVLQAIHLAYFAYITRDAPAQRLPTGNPEATAAPEADSPGSNSYTDSGLDDLLYREPVNQASKDAWQVTERLVLQINEEVKSKGAAFLVVTLSNGPQVSPNVASRQLLMKDLGVTNLFYADFRIKSLGERNGFAVLNLAPEMEVYADLHRAYLHGFGDRLGAGHWNAIGHRVAGESIARHLCENNLSTKTDPR